MINPVRQAVLCLLLLAVVSSWACVHYQPLAVDPAATIQRLEARSLADPGLARAVERAHLTASWPPDAWDLQTLTLAGLYFHPDLAVARASWAVVRAGIVTAGGRPNPAVTAGPGFNASTPARTITPWILNFDFDFTIETAGKRRLRVDLATRLAESARYQIAETAWQVRAQVRQALLDLFASTEMAALLDFQRAVQESNLALFQRQLDAGEISAFQMSQARLMLSAVRVSLFDAERQQQDARSRLATAVGLPAAALHDTRFSFAAFRLAPNDLPDAAARRQTLLNRADVLSALSDYEASQTSLQLEIARQYPDLHLGPGYQMDQSSHKWSLLSPLALPVFNRNQGPIAEAESRRLLVAARVEAVQARALGALDRALATYRAILPKVAMTEQMIGEMQRVEETTERQLAAGDISQLDLGIVQVELAARELSRLEALLEAQRALGDIEDAMQRPADLPADLVSGLPQ